MTHDLKERIAMVADAIDLPPMILASVARDGSSFDFAFNKHDERTSFSLDTVCWLASMTKLVTSVAVLQLVERGKLTLGTDAWDYLPELRDTKVLVGFDAEGSATLAPPETPIIIRQLLTHTAGFSYDTWNAQTDRFMRQNDLPGVITCKSEALSLPLGHHPGARWEYGINLDFIGRIVEQVSGCDLATYFTKNVFEPLGMRDTSFLLREDQKVRLADMMRRSGDGEVSAVQFDLINQSPEFFMGGAGLYGTARDYLKLLQALIRGGSLDSNAILKEETVGAMCSNQIGDLRVRPLPSIQPEWSNDMSAVFRYGDKWGFGSLISDQNLPSGAAAGSMFWGGVANTYFWADCKSGLAGVMMTQLLPFADPGVLAAFDGLRKAGYARQNVS